MKQILQFVVFAFLAFFGVANIAIADETKQLVGQAFTKICFDHLPDFSGTQETLENAGYVLAPFGEGEFEFSHPTNGIWGAYAIGKNNGGCTVAHEGLTYDEAKLLAHDLMVNWLGAEPDIWEYEGVPSAYTTSFENDIFYLIFNEGGLSADIRSE